LTTISINLAYSDVVNYAKKIIEEVEKKLEEDEIKKKK